MAFVEGGKEDFIQGGHGGDIGTTAMGVLQWGRDWTQFQIQHGRNGNLWLRKSVDGKLLGGNSRIRGHSG